MAAVLGSAFFDLISRAWNKLPSVAELTRSMSSDALRDGSRYL